MKLEAFKYWLRINGYRPDQFGTGTKNNPIKIIVKSFFIIINNNLVHTLCIRRDNFSVWL